MGKMGLGLPAFKQGDLFDQLSATVTPKKSLAEGFAKIREKGSLDEKVLDEMIQEKSNPPETPDSWKIDLKLIAYGTLVTVEVILTGLAMFSLGHNLTVSIGLVIIGVVCTLLGVYLFIQGGTVGKLVWFVYAVLFVLLNWSWTVNNLIAETGETVQVQVDRTADREELANNTAMIGTILEAIAKAPAWGTEKLESLEKRIEGLEERNKEIKALLSVPVKVASLGTFDTMGDLFGLDGLSMARFWWLGAFVIMQGFMVIVAPRRAE